MPKSRPCGSPANVPRAAPPLCHARTVLPPGQNAPLHPSYFGLGRPPRGRGHARSVSRSSRWGHRRIVTAGLTVDVGLMETEARRLNSPYLKLLSHGPAVDHRQVGHDARRQDRHPSRESRWISNPQSPRIVHSLRGRVDAIMVGRETAVRDNPLLTARPSGPRTAVRVVLDTRASLGNESQLVQTARETPVLIAVGAIPIRRPLASWQRGLRSFRLRRIDARRAAGRFTWNWAADG